MSDSNVRLKRAYDEPTDDDGYRVLVDGIWPRGRRREDLRLGRWARELAPSAALRSWYGHDPARWAEFRRRYLVELGETGRARALEELTARATREPVTLVFGARDGEHSQAQVLADELVRRLGGRPKP